MKEDTREKKGTSFDATLVITYTCTQSYTYIVRHSQTGRNKFTNVGVHGVVNMNY